MKDVYILNIDSEKPAVYTALKKLMRDIGREKQYQTYMRRLKESSEVPIGSMTIQKALLIRSERK